MEQPEQRLEPREPRGANVTVDGALPGGAATPPDAADQPAKKKKGGSQAAGVGVVGLLVAAKAGALKALLTVGTILVSIVAYSARYGLAFAVGLVALLFFHEAGHWLAYRRKGITPDAMIFIPFFGAAVIARQHPELSALDDALIALAGPILGGLVAAACLPLAFIWPAHGPFLVSLAATGFLINALNLLPIGPLDGAHVRRAISRRRTLHPATSGQRWFCGALFVGVAALLVAGLVNAQGSLGDALAEGSSLYHFYTPPTPKSSPDGLAVSPAGIVWFTERHANAIGRLDPTTGAIQEYPIPTRASQALRITPGPDGAMWFTEAFGDAIGRVTSDGHITEFALPTRNAFAWDIAAGPDGALWFVEHDAARIGRITTAGKVTEFLLAHGRNPSGIVAGPDGALWFLEDDGAWRGIGRITTSGVVTEYLLPVKDSGPQMLANGGDGRLYATLVKGNAIARITPGAPAPRIALFRLPAPTPMSGSPAPSSNDPFALASGLGGLWFTELGSNVIGRFTPDGTISEYFAYAGQPMQHTFPAIIAGAPDRTLWFTAADQNDDNSRVVHLTGVPSTFDRSQQ